jgi:Rrf2 family iron-sulfur cluster assembly transcriptional regulator
MDIVRRNTDYALRAMIHLAEHYGNGAVSAREVARQGGIPYQLVCKLLQRLGKAGLIRSSMGARGGFKLRKDPSKISVLQVIETIQGPVRLNRCLLSAKACLRQRSCPVKPKLAELQKTIGDYLGGIKLDELVKSSRAKTKISHEGPKAQRK